ncbi:MAG TPA: hypothetical protein VFV30_00380 [Novosphingobium sp.]|nr:hypothetical protein [Novosphingobium sp.]
MRKLIHAAILAGLSLAASSATADPRPSPRLPDLFLRFTVMTGSDDLRGGRDNVMVTPIIRGNPTREWMLNQRAMRWADRSTHSTTIPLPPNTRPRDVEMVVLRTTFRGGIDGDNWNMTSVTIEMTDASRSAYVKIGEGGPKRFTGDDRKLRIPVQLPGLSDTLKTN